MCERAASRGAPLGRELVGPGVEVPNGGLSGLNLARGLGESIVDLGRGSQSSSCGQLFTA